MNFADQEEIAESQRNRHRKRQHTMVWNILTAIFIIASIFAVGYFAILFSDPATSLNPYPPPTLPVLIQLPTSTPTLVELPATWTPTATATLTATPLPPATDTPVVIDLTTLQASPSIPSPTGSSSKYLFIAQGGPIARPNTDFHPDLDCHWQGIAGTVKTVQGTDLIQYKVELQGTYNGKSIETTTLSGAASLWYGPSGYEFSLGNTPIDSIGQLTVQLEDQSGLALSDKIVLNTYSDCNKNLILVNFQAVR